MEINEKTKIQYIFENEDTEEMIITLTMEQIEGSTPNFYKQFKQLFKGEKWEIKKRIILLD